MTPQEPWDPRLVGVMVTWDLLLVGVPWAMQAHVTDFEVARTAQALLVYALLCTGTSLTLTS